MLVQGPRFENYCFKHITWHVVRALQFALISFHLAFDPSDTLSCAKIKYGGNKRKEQKSRKVGGGLDVCMTPLGSLKGTDHISPVVSTVSDGVSHLKSLYWQSQEYVLLLT